MPGRIQRAPSLELFLLAAALGCRQPPDAEKPARARSTGPVVSAVSLLPRAASNFECDAAGCLQRHPRLPDSGEWRCAERAHVVWCAGGEPAAGVVSGPADRGYRCGRRWGSARQERVCIDRQPDYPDKNPQAFSCRFEQERGIARRCVQAAIEPARPLSEHAVPGCWLNQDCRSRLCDRGNCNCQGDGDCEVGRCQQGSCVEVKKP